VQTDRQGERSFGLDVIVKPQGAWLARSLLVLSRGSRLACVFAGSGSSELPLGADRVISLDSKESGEFDGDKVVYVTCCIESDHVKCMVVQ
jgi:hypothetical protein